MGTAAIDRSDDPFDDLLAAIARVRAHGAARRQPEALTSDLIRLRHACDLIELDFSERAAAFCATYDENLWGSTTSIDWIRHECHMAGPQAADRVAVGEAMPRLAQSAQAVAAGQIGFAHLVVMARTERALTQWDAACEFDETQVLAQAKDCSVGKLWRICQHLRHSLDPRGFAEDERRAALANYLRVTTKDDGALILNGWLDPAGSAAVRTALEPLARPDGPEDEREREHRFADALVELATFALDNGHIPQRASNRPHLAVTVSLETLRGLPGAPAADLEFGAPISAEAVRRLACDASIRRIVLDPTSAVIDVGRARRVVSPTTRHALDTRDRTCRWPGCERPPSWSAAHHFVHWTAGGPTDLSNLLLLCHRHHRAVHEGGWQIIRTEDGAIQTIRPSPIDYFWRRVA